MILLYYQRRNDDCVTDVYITDVYSGLRVGWRAAGSGGSYIQGYP